MSECLTLGEGIALFIVGMVCGVLYMTVSMIDWDKE